MKTVFSLLFFCALSAHADLVIHDNGTLTKDGISLNNASDALLNRQVTSAEFTAALQARLSAASAAVARAKSDLDTLQKQINDQLAGTLAQLQSALAGAGDDAAKASINAQIDLVKTFQVAAGKSPAQLELEAAQAAADKAAADLAAAQAKLGQQ